MNAPTAQGPATWEVRPEDREFFAIALDGFVPDRVFDAHAHLWENPDDWTSGRPSGPGRGGLAQFQETMSDLLPGRLTGGIFMGARLREGYESNNSFVRGEIAGNPNAHGHLVVPPGLDPEQVRASVKESGFRGLKVYHTFAPSQDTWNAEISEFVPEQYIRVCHEESWSITLHIVRERALSDSRNQQWIERASKKYPNAKLILAHAARGFNAYHTVSGVDALRGLHNVWFDTAAVTEPQAFEAIISTMGPERLLWGSDYPVGNIRGRVVTLGDTFIWLNASDMNLTLPHGTAKPYLVIHESLRALQQATASAHLTDTQIEGIFWGNIHAMFAGLF